MGLRDELTRLFAADEAARSAESALLAGSPEEVRPLLAGSIEETLAASVNEAQRVAAEARLERLADLCAQVGGKVMVDGLIRILNHEEPAVRVAAGESLLELAYERYAEVARAIEDQLDKRADGPAMAELAYLVAEVGEPSAVPLLRKFLKLDDAEVLAAAIESLAGLGDPRAVADLKPFVGDSRRVVLDDAEEETESTLGELAEEAIAELGDTP